MKASPGNQTMIDISTAIQEGAMAFLSREYKALIFFVLGLAVVLSIGLKG